MSASPSGGAGENDRAIPAQGSAERGQRKKGSAHPRGRRQATSQHVGRSPPGTRAARGSRGERTAGEGQGIGTTGSWPGRSPALQGRSWFRQGLGRARNGTEERTGERRGTPSRGGSVGFARRLLLLLTTLGLPSRSPRRRRGGRIPPVQVLHRRDRNHGRPVRRTRVGRGRAVDRDGLHVRSRDHRDRQVRRGRDVPRTSPRPGPPRSTSPRHAPASASTSTAKRKSRSTARAPRTRATSTSPPTTAAGSARSTPRANSSGT